MLSDLPTALWWYFVITTIGIIFLPITTRIFKNFFDRGYAFSKILGLLLTTYTVWILGSLKILPFTNISVLLIIVVYIAINAYLILKNPKLKDTKIQNKFKDSKIQNNNVVKEIFSLNFESLSSLNLREFLSFKNRSLIYILEELLFLTAFLFWLWVRGHEPSVHGLEKFMDFGFMNSILQTKFFPPQDMWLAPANPELAEGLASNLNRYTGGFFINYYYYGHYVTAFLMKLTGILPEISYNLMLSTLFGLCFSASFSIGYNLYLLSKKLGLKIKEEAEEYKQLIFNHKAILTGLLAGLLVTIAGNLHTIYIFTSGYPNESPVPFWQILKFTINQTYWYPNATRFIPNTIHEFPSYSWVVADLHGHVLDIPFVLLTIALLLSFITKSWYQNLNICKNSNVKAQSSKQAQILKFNNLKFIENCLPAQVGLLKIGHLLLLSLLTAVMYMTNAWDGVIYLGLAGLVIVAKQVFFNLQIARNATPACQRLALSGRYSVAGGLEIRSIRNSIKPILLQVIILFAGFIIFSLPFNLSFVPFVHGIGVVGGWEMANSLGLIKDTVASGPINNTANSVVHFGPFLLEKGNSLRSPLWMLAVLWGFFYFHVILFISNLIRTVLLASKGQSFKEEVLSINPSNVFVLLLIIISTGLLIFPEFFYMKDIYPGHYRANTMFKLGYQAFIMLSIVSAYVIVNPNFKSQISNLKSNFLAQLGIRSIRIIQLAIIILVLIYPYYGIQSFYGAFGNRKYEGQNGLIWLKNTHPGDYGAVLWLRKNSTSDIRHPTSVLEAVGDSYTDYARISANTGIPTVLGWPVHEWLWRGSYDEPGKRVEEVKRMYETPQTAKDLFNKYQVKYVVIGNLERQKYTSINEEYFEDNAEVVFSSNYTKIYKLKI